MTATKEKEVTSSNNIQDDGNIDKIRDILFGVQVRDFEKRFTKLEVHFDKEIETTQREIQKQITSLENTLKKEIGALTDKLSVEQDVRKNMINGVAEDVKVAASNFKEQISSIINTAKINDAELREHIALELKLLSKEIEKNREETIKTFEEESGDLQDTKADRDILAKIFTDMGQRLLKEEKEAKTKKD